MLREGDASPSKVSASKGSARKPSSGEKSNLIDCPERKKGAEEEEEGEVAYGTRGGEGGDRRG